MRGHMQAQEKDPNPAVKGIRQPGDGEHCPLKGNRFSFTKHLQERRSV